MIPEMSSRVPPVPSRLSLYSVPTGLPAASVIDRSGHGKWIVVVSAIHSLTTGICEIEKTTMMTTYGMTAFQVSRAFVYSDWSILTASATWTSVVGDPAPIGALPAWG